jgi:hypothetical protein
MLGGALHGVEQSLGAVVIFEREQPLDALGQRLSGGGQALQIALGSFAQRDERGDFLGVPVASVALEGHLAVLGQFEALFALPTARMGGHGLVLEVAREGVVIGFDGDGFSDEPRRDCIGIAIEVNGEIGVHLGWRRIAAIG